MKKIKFSFLFFLFLTCSLFSQEIICDKPEIAEAYNLAANTVKINIRRGILAAGGDYGGEWTRDISVNSWNCISLLYPEVAENSLWSVTIGKDTIGHQYWDKIIWVVAACNHFKATGDLKFLKKAYRCSANTMKQLEQTAFDKETGLFTGPSFFNDGIAGYPEPVFEPANFSSYVLDHKNSYKIKCLSTNCLYFGAYNALTQMGLLLNEDKAVISGYELKAKALKNQILAKFYDKEKNEFSYIIDHKGSLLNYQEGSGISFAVIFGVLEGEKAHRLINNAKVSRFGITSVFPDFPRYSAEKPGRHNNIIWPVVNGFFAQAASLTGNYDIFTNELFSLTHLALDEDKGNYNFREIYNPLSGKPDGGYQGLGKSDPDHHWESCKLQTWSATAYINMVQNGLAGIKISSDGITFSPYLPAGIHYLELKNILYHQANLDVVIKGNGKKIKTFLLNGKKMPKPAIASGMKGPNKISIELE